VDGDGCSSQCLSELIAGERSRAARRTDCFQEWLTNPRPDPDSGGLLRGRIECRDDDPTCDFGTTSGDEACTFQVALCFNVTDPREIDPQTGDALCTPDAVARVHFISPRETRPRDATDAANLDALESVVTAIGGTIQGVCRDSKGATLCTTDNDCPDVPASGACEERLLAFEPALTTPHECTDFAQIVVPLWHRADMWRTGVRRIRVQTIGPEDSTGGRAVDRDVLRLVCKPGR
jgi:hypothetical protein